MIRLPVPIAARPYEVLIGGGLLDDLGGLLESARLHGRPAVIADERALALHGPRALATLDDPLVLSVPAGEASKSLGLASRLWDELLAARVGREDVIVALGGGVVGDLAGFVAATLHRGVPFVQVPTTLLAQVDASVGGKVAIDHPLGKNLVGAFHQPRLVVADTDTLASLPVRQRWNGLAEIAKAALLGDVELLGRLEDELEEIAAAPPAAVIARAVSVKAKVVAADEREAGLRRILNLGHTVGHALEHAAGYRDDLLHGEAVVLGMRAAVAVSSRHAGLSRADAQRILALLDRFPLPPLPPLDPQAVLEAALHDKKRSADGIRFVVLRRPGEATTIPADASLLQEAIASVLERNG